MQPTTEILERISKDSLTHKEEVFTRLYRYLLRPDIYYQAYQRLYTNKGASTKGINQDTADGFSEAKIEKIIQSLADETYQPTPVRRTYIAKKSNPKKKRPLGIPTFTDKLVQEALRMILEAIYEPLFLDCSHGFRPKRSCHTALDKLKYQFGGVRWFVEGDIKGCFDNINHDALVGFIGSKVKDARIVKLVYKFLKAGYSRFSSAMPSLLFATLTAWRLNIQAVQIVVSPLAHCIQNRNNTLSKWGKRIYRLGRLFWNHFTMNHAVVFQIVKLLRKHLRRGVWNQPL